MPVTEMMMRLIEREESERLLRFVEARKAYDGELEDPLKPTKADPSGKDNVKLNFSRLVVDIGVDFLFGVGVEFNREKDENPQEVSSEAATVAPEDQWLDEFWEYNRKPLILTDIGINGGVCGHAFVKMTRPTAQTKSFPRLVVLDPATVTPFHELDDYDDIFAWRIQWNTLDFRTGKPVVRRQTIERNDQRTSWTITDQVAETPSMSGMRNAWFTFQAAGGWKLLGTEVWPYAFSPIFHCKNLPAPNCFWGTSDLEKDIVDTNKSVNAVLSKMNRIIAQHAHPQPVGKGFNAKDAQWGEGGIFVIPSKDGEINYLEMKGDLQSSIELYMKLKEAYHEMSRVPEIATGKVDGIGALSGVALKLLYGPFAAKTRTKQESYGEMLAMLNSCALEIAGKAKGLTIENHFGSVTPVDDKEDAETATIYETLGVSKDTLLKRLGFDPATERAKKQDEQSQEADLGAQLLAQFDRGQGSSRVVAAASPTAGGRQQTNSGA